VTNESSTLSDYLRVLRRRKSYILAACVLIPVVAVLLTLRSEVRYEAQASVSLDDSSLADQLNGAASNGAAQAPVLSDQQQQQLLTREAQVAESSAVEQNATHHLIGFLKGANLKDVARVTVSAPTGLLLFVAQSRVPASAAAIANGYAAAFLDHRRDLRLAQYQATETQLDLKLANLTSPQQQATALYKSLLAARNELEVQKLLVSSGGTIVDVSEPQRSGPTLVRNAILGLSLGVVVGVLLAFLADALDRRISSVKDLDDIVALPLLAEVPDVRSRDRAGGLCVMRDAPLTPSAEAFRSLRAGVEFAMLHADDREVRALNRGWKLLVTSASDGEGKTVTACNLATAFALSGRSVTLVDLDLRHASAHRVLSLQRAPGVREIATGETTIADATITVDLLQGGRTRVARHRVFQRYAAEPGASRPVLVDVPVEKPLLDDGGPMRFIPAGEPPANVGDFVARLDVPGLLEKLQPSSEIIIIDAPPVLAGGDGVLLSSTMDCVLLVTRLGVSDRQRLLDARRKLSQSPAQTIGYVVTAAERDPEHAHQVYGADGNRRWPGGAPAP
jgi:Mrp family chromosome partitioning ATPase/capsular polysaccharide biosynthesis protein